MSLHSHCIHSIQMRSFIWSVLYTLYSSVHFYWKMICNDVKKRGYFGRYDIYKRGYWFARTVMKKLQEHIFSVDDAIYQWYFIVKFCGQWFLYKQNDFSYVKVVRFPCEYWLGNSIRYLSFFLKKHIFSKIEGLKS